jgi:hypothetical protein
MRRRDLVVGESEVLVVAVTDILWFALCEFEIFVADTGSYQGEMRNGELIDRWRIGGLEVLAVS